MFTFEVSLVSLLMEHLTHTTNLTSATMKIFRWICAQPTSLKHDRPQRTHYCGQ